jgi:FtsH-binding integral membrane protein
VFSNIAVTSDSEIANDFIRARTEAHLKFIEQTEKTKRFGYGLSAALIVIAMIAPVFVPSDRETISWVTSATLALFSAGAFGYSKFKIRALKQSIDASSK